MVKQPKMTEDFRAIGLIQQLAAKPEALHPKDQARIVKALGNVFDRGRVRPPDGTHLYREAADALAKFGEEAGRTLQRAIDDDRIKDRDYAPLRAHMIVALGRTKDEKQVDWLLEQALRSPDDDVLAAAGEALGNFTELPMRPRREVVKRMIRFLGGLVEKASRPINPDPNAPIDFSPQNARATLDKVQSKWNATLAALTGQNFSEQSDWQHWLNKNPDWTPPGGAPRK